MPRQHRSAAPFLLLALLAASGAFAQTPAALPQLDVATTRDSQLLVSTAVDGLGNVTLLWSQLFVDELPDEFVRGRLFSAADIPMGPDIVLDARKSQAVEVVANKRGAGR